MSDPRAFKLTLLKLAAYYDKVLTDQQLQVYAEQLSRFLSPEECERAITLYVDNPQNEFFPRPVSKLVELIKKPIKNEDLSQNITSILLNAVKKFGDYWSEGFYQNGEFVFEGKDRKIYSNWDDAAKSIFGDMGLQVVRRSGGWKHFCSSCYEQPEGVVRGQMTRLGTSLLNITEKTGDADKVQIERRDQETLSTLRNEQINQLRQIIKPKDPA